ncbi:hypothetical protein JD844_007840, partial [Phrynosoma platyrhinos]
MSIWAAMFWPIQLSQQVRTTAEFHCNISNVAVLDYFVNWYKLGTDGQPRKLDTRESNKKYRITCLDSQMAKMTILKLEKNDSGTYFCTLVSFSLNQTLKESNRGNLTVTEFAPKSELPEEEEEDQGHNDENTDENTDHKIPLAIGLSGLVLVLVLGFLCFFLNVIWRKQGRRKLHDENAPL